MWHGKCIPSSCVLQKRKPGKGHELWRGPYLCLEALFALSAHALYKGTRPSLPSCWGSRYKLLYLKQITNRTNCSRERCSVLCGGLDGRGFGGEWTHGYCMAESLWCPLETITTLLIGWTPIQNKKLNKIQEKKKSPSTPLWWPGGTLPSFSEAQIPSNWGTILWLRIRWATSAKPPSEMPGTQ